MRETILDLLNQKGDLPPFPDFLINLQQKLRDPYVNVEEISKLIQVEPVLAGNILKLSNSAFYKTGYQEVKSLSHAINKLGLTIIKHLAFSLKLTSLFSRKTVIDQYRFWCHSIGVAIVTKKLAVVCNLSEQIQDDAYLAGLMHDVGIKVFSYLIHDQYSDFAKKARNNSEPLHKQEEDFFGINHQELGALFISKWWNIEEKIVATVKSHHSLVQGDTDSIKCTQLVNIANGLCNMQGFGNSIESANVGYSENAVKNLGLSSSDIDNMIDDIDDAIGEAVEICGKKG